MPYNQFTMKEAADTLAVNHFSVIPVNYDKRPNLKTWKPFQENIPTPFEIIDMFAKNETGIAIVSGKVSGYTEILDEDLKYDLTGTIHEEFITGLKEHAPGLLEKLLIQKTRNGGYHYIYRCNDMEGNLKLASRPASQDEQQKHPQEKVKVLYETRGEGGYFVCAPTPGYEIIQGDFSSIQTITKEERETLFTLARSFDQCPKEFIPPQFKVDFTFRGLTSFDDYDNKADVVALLQKHGWTVAFSKGSRTFLKRPGDTRTAQSANFDSDKNRFTVFSTSTEFETQKSYKLYAVYTVLECGGDFSKASKQLYDLGYGDRKTNTNSGYDKFFKVNFPNAKIDPAFDVASHIICAPQLLQLDIAGNRYILPPFLPMIGTAVLAGAPDVCKSQFARMLCISVASGLQHFINLPLTLTHKRALYIATEDDAHNTSFLMQKQLAGLGQKATDNLGFIFADTLSPEEILLALDLHLTQNPCDLVIVDSFGDIFQGSDANSTTQMRKNVRSFDYFAKKHKCLILFVHHINKAAYTETPHQKNIMGGGGLTQKVRFAWQLTSGEGNTKYLTVVKGNYCPREFKENSLVLSFSEDNFLFTNSGDKTQTATINISGGKKGKDIQFDKLITLADEIFNKDAITYKTFCERHARTTTNSIAQAGRDHAAMKKLEIIIKDEDYPKLWKLNGEVNNMENPNDPDEPTPF